MITFTEDAKTLYTLFRIFEFNTGEAVTDCLDGLDLNNLSAWIDNSICIDFSGIIDETYDCLSDLLDKVLSEKIGQYLDVGSGLTEYMSLCFVSVYLMDTGQYIKYIPNIMPPENNVYSIIEDEIALIESALSTLNQLENTVQNFF